MPSVKGVVCLRYSNTHVVKKLNQPLPFTMHLALKTAYVCHQIRLKASLCSIHKKLLIRLDPPM